MSFDVIFTSLRLANNPFVNWLFNGGQKMYTVGLPRKATKSELILNVICVILIRQLYYLNMENASNCFKPFLYWTNCSFSQGLRVLSLN